ncbi:tetratricopeptide repeat protein [Plantactinospora sp. DSM 117369]
MPGALAVDDDAANAALDDAQAAYERGDHTTAVAAVRLAALQDDDDYTWYAIEHAEQYATECAGSGNHVAALRYVEAMLRFPVEPDCPELRQAGILAYQGEIGRARARYLHLTDHPNSNVRLLATGRLLALLQEQDNLAGPADRAGAANGGTAASNPAAQALLESQLGKIQRKRGDREGALRTLRAAADSGEQFALFGFSSRATYDLAGTFREEDPDRARELYPRTLRIPVDGEPDTATPGAVRMCLGSLAKRNRDWPEASRWFQQVIDSGDQIQTALAAAHLGEIAYWQEDHATAARYYELTLASRTESAGLVGEAAYRLGGIRAAEGDIDRARSHLLRAARSGHKGFAEQADRLLRSLAPSAGGIQ